MTEKKYRPDVDGLRAIAVLLVLMFHLGLGVPGGYIGVDVFFVISGFLITSIILREIEHGEFTIGGFYARRARRILPALLATMLLSSIAAMVIFLPSELERYAKSVLAALLSISNFWFWSQGGYFGVSSETAPLLHTWTLGVEEQFYIFLPIALVLLYRFAPQWAARILLVGCFGTFAASAWFVTTRTPEVFYFSPFRAWELLSGSLLAVYRLPVVVHNGSRQLIAALGLFFVITPAFMYSAVTVFPGPAAALPCIGAAVLIWIGASGESAVGFLLKNRLVVFIGQISYSLYLWHWPLLAFAKYILGASLTLYGSIVIGLVSMALATISWQFIEKPFRSRLRTTNRQSWFFLGGASVVLSLMMAAVLLSHGLSKRFTPQVVALDRARVREVVRPECIDIRVPLKPNTACRIGAQGDPSVLVWGDSYAHAMLPALDVAFRQLGVAAWFAAESGCPPLPTARVSFRGRDNWRCRELNERVVTFVQEHPELTKIVLVSAWDSYADESSGYELRTVNSSKSAMSLKQSIEALAEWSKEAQPSRELIVVSQVPSFGWSVPHKMLVRELKGEPVLPLTHREWLIKSTRTRDIFSELSTSQHIKLIDSSEWLCATGLCRYANDNEQPLYWDGGHLNAEGARFIAPMLEATFRDMIQGPNGSRGK